MTSCAAPAISSATAICVAWSSYPSESRWPSRSSQRRDARDTERDIGGPETPRAPERVRDDDADLDAGELADPRPQSCGRCVWVEREQDERVRPFRVGGIDAGRRAHEPVPRLGDDERRARAQDLTRLTRGSPRCAAGRSRPRARAHARKARRRQGGRRDPRPSRPPSARRRGRRPRSKPVPPREAASTTSAARSSPSSSSGIPRSGITRSSRVKGVP